MKRKVRLKAECKAAVLEKVIDDGDYRLATPLDARMAFSASSPGFKLSGTTGDKAFKRTGPRIWICIGEDSKWRLSEAGVVSRKLV